MTSTDLLDQPAAARDATRWTLQQRHLWVGRHGDRSVGTIQEGRDYRFYDLDAEARCSHPTLEDAIGSHTGDARCTASLRARRSGAATLLTGLAAAASLLVGGAAVLVTSW